MKSNIFWDTAWADGERVQLLWKSYRRVKNLVRAHLKGNANMFFLICDSLHSTPP